MRTTITLTVAGIICFVLAGSALAANQVKLRDFRLERSMSKQAQACLECHKQEHPGIFSDWAASRHASANITCIDCHLADETDQDISKTHFKQYQRSDTPWGRAEYRVPIAEVVTPKDCSRCHPDEVKQYSRSKHANTIEIMWKIDPWLNKGMNSETERQAGCYYCHGTVLEMDKEGRLASDVWPNVGVGRINLDGSKGSCTSCHTRHRFPLPKPANLRPVVNVIWGRTIHRLRFSPNPSTVTSMTPLAMSTTGTLRPEPGPLGLIIVVRPVRPAI